MESKSSNVSCAETSKTSKHESASMLIKKKCFAHSSIKGTIPNNVIQAKNIPDRGPGARGWGTLPALI